ncbi:Uncharacterised protein [Mycobacterium tuberculosis]|nr:Uncharacterised protein [Mycobacterium tuberculosis]
MTFYKRVAACYLSWYFVKAPNLVLQRSRCLMNDRHSCKGDSFFRIIGTREVYGGTFSRLKGISDVFKGFDFMLCRGRQLILGLFYFDHCFSLVVL